MISQDIRSNRDRYLAIMAEHGTLAPQDIVASVSETQADLHAVFSSASVEVAARKPAPNEWCLLELVRHAAFTERLVGKLIHHLARDAYPSAEDFEGAGIGMMPDDDHGYAEVLDDLALKNAALLDEVRDLPDAPNVEMKADHPFFGPLNCKEWAGFQRVHDLDHIQHARKILADIGGWADARHSPSPTSDSHPGRPRGRLTPLPEGDGSKRHSIEAQPPEVRARMLARASTQM